VTTGQPNNRVALVTGAGRGIGRELAQRLAKTGWDVGLTARSADELAVTADFVRAEGRREVTVAGDVSLPDHVEVVCSSVEDGLGPVDVLVNNAAIVGEYVPVVESQPDDWWRVVEINVRGPFMFSRRLVPAMVSRGHGYVININSLDCSRPARNGSSSYSVSKSALRRLTEILAMQVEGTGVIVVDLSPGLVRTAMGGSRPDADQLPAEAWLDPSVVADKVEQIISGRYDALHGRFLHSRDDLGSVLAAVANAPDARSLRLVPAGDTDPIVSYAAMTDHRPR
jgi:3-oxoacyl-[acyl-carrier protein] reductase